MGNEDIVLVELKIAPDYRSLSFEKNDEKVFFKECVKKMMPNLKIIYQFLSKKSASYFFSSSNTKDSFQYQLRGNHRKFLIIDSNIGNRYLFSFKTGELFVNDKSADKSVLNVFSRYLSIISNQIKEKKIRLEIKSN